MARKRMLSPDFFTSASVNQLTIPAMLTFAGLWVYCDDEGRGEDETALVKATVWPRRKAVTEPKIEQHLVELDGLGMICRYGFAGMHLLHIPAWTEHQKPSHPLRSRFGPCAAHEPEAFAIAARDAQVGFARESRAPHEGLPPGLVQSGIEQLGLGDGGWCEHIPPLPADCLTCRRLLQVRA